MFIIRSLPLSPNQNPKPAFISIISGTGEYDETVLLHALKSLLVVLKSLYFEKTPNEALVIEVYLRPQQLNPKPLTFSTALRQDMPCCGGNDLWRRAGAGGRVRKRQELQDDAGRGVIAQREP